MTTVGSITGSSIERRDITPITIPNDSEDELCTSDFDHSGANIDDTLKRIKVAVIGTGYVGLHLVNAFSPAYDVIAFDISESRVAEVKQSVGKRVACTTDQRLLSQATHFLIAVSTVLDSQGHIDTSCLQKAIMMLEEHAPPGTTVVIESSVAVGMTRDLLEPLMRSKNLKCGMSPERGDPGRTYPHYSTIPKIVSGLNSDSLQSIHALHSRVFENIVPVTTPEVAEMTKLYENCQRMMCIAYVNEMAGACNQLSKTLSSKTSRSVDIDPFEVCQAAATKPFGYLPFTPSLGVGGHCIPVNPYYMLSNCDFPPLKSCTQRMADRPARMGDRIMSQLRSHRRPRILVVGLGFKRGQSVLSNSPGKALAIHLLSTYDVYVQYADPWVAESGAPFIPRLDESVDWNVKHLQQFAAIVVAVNQPGLDLQVLQEGESKGVHVEWFCPS
ncbi:hypothetical protein AC579_5173 [Pseudocercospora musae]|uniref:UDP-glucose/GDP-mannose dehydrogenase C-terminal domain-containing protein n=1 Tax=Pseudocercospora musae TaxID=113226 RepID=A0A139I8M2_9PEZI|nr:hypothetical protein AC579_5173 [Pseudocercospora musae]